MTDERILDVRAEPPVRRHAVIFEAFEARDPVRIGRPTAAPVAPVAGA